MNLPFITQDNLYILLSFITLICVYASFKSYKTFIWIIRTKKTPIKSLLNNFKQKMWMTLGLGFIFFGFYFVLIFSISQLMSKEDWLSLFFYMYKEPTYFIYLGLFLFAFLSLSIYFVRMFIKYLYTTRSKDL